MGDLPELPEDLMLMIGAMAHTQEAARPLLRSDIRAAIRSYAEEAVRQEREACLTICAELHEHYSGYKDTALLNGDVELSNAASGEPRACEAIAAAIRARSEQ